MDLIVPNWKLQKKSKIYMTWVFFSLTRAPLGGGQILPPLSNIRDNLRTT